MLATKLLLPLVFFILNNNILAQNDSTHNQPYGSAKELKGRILIVNCFVSEGKKKWDNEEKKEILDREKYGISWLHAQALKWKMDDDLNFQRINIGLEQDIKIEKIENYKELSKSFKINWTSLAIHAAGYPSLINFYDSIKNATQVDNVVVIVFAYNKGRSYAQASTSNNRKSPYFLEGAVVYNTDTNNFNIYNGTIMHEMLHLFGAWDMYREEATAIRSPEMDAKIKGVFANSIMLDANKNNIDDLVIDQMTAWRIGWTKRYWSYFEMFRWVNNAYWTTIPGSPEQKPE